uniref:Putative secreted protein n=1 Tax=Anopheles triannulatus TaxID=58253 RepID=A0A2M4B6J4_9DIPT
MMLLLASHLTLAPFSNTCSTTLNTLVLLLQKHRNENGPKKSESEKKTLCSILQRHPRTLPASGGGQSHDSMLPSSSSSAKSRQKSYFAESRLARPGTLVFATSPSLSKTLTEVNMERQRLCAPVLPRLPSGMWFFGDGES